MRAADLLDQQACEEVTDAARRVRNDDLDGSRCLSPRTVV